MEKISISRAVSIIVLIILTILIVLSIVPSIPEQTREITVRCYDANHNKIEDLTCTDNITCTLLDQLTSGCEEAFKYYLLKNTK